MIARENQSLFSKGIGCLPFQQHEVLDNPSKAFLGEYFFPQICSLVAIGIGRIAFTLIVPFVEGQEVCFAACKLRCHEHFIGVHGHMNQSSAEL